MEAGDLNIKHTDANCLFSHLFPFYRWETLTWFLMNM